MQLVQQVILQGGASVDNVRDQIVLSIATFLNPIGRRPSPTIKVVGDVVGQRQQTLEVVRVVTTVLVDDEFLLLDLSFFRVVVLFVAPSVGIFFAFGRRQIQVGSLKRRVLYQFLLDSVFQRSLSHLQDLH